MKAVTGDLPPPGDAWAGELKYDGMRIVAAVGDPGQPLRLDTTTGADALNRFPELHGLPRALALRPKLPVSATDEGMPAGSPTANLQWSARWVRCTGRRVLWGRWSRW